MCQCKNAKGEGFFAEMTNIKMSHRENTGLSAKERFMFGHIKYHAKNKLQLIH